MPLRLLSWFRSSMSIMIAVVIAVPVVVVMLLFSYHHYTYERETISQNAQTELLRVAQDFKDVAEASYTAHDMVRLQSALDQQLRQSDLSFLAVFDPAGRVLACSDRKWIGSTIRDMHPETASNEDLFAVNKAFSGGYSAYFDEEDNQNCLVIPLKHENSSGAVLLSLDLTDMNRRIKRSRFENYFLAVLVAAVLGGILYILLNRLITRRVKAVSGAALRIASGDMSARALADGNDEIGYLATSFNLLADEITNWRDNLEEIASNRLNDLLFLYDIVNTVSQSLDLETVLPKVIERVTDNLRESKGVIVLALDGDGHQLVAAAKRGLSDESISSIMDHGSGGIGDVILKNRSLRIASGDSGHSPYIAGLENDRIQSALVAPIGARGAILGAVAVFSERQERFSDRDETLLGMIANQASVAVQNARLYEKTLELARIDGLTGVANRRYFMERLKQEAARAVRYQAPLSILMLDLDRFKSFNDTYGHLKGDELLQKFGTAVKTTIRSTDIAGRYGGEEFCVALPHTSLKRAVVIAERIRKIAEELSIPNGKGRPPIGRTVSVGVSEFIVGDTLELLVGRADEALYQAKEKGRNRVCCH